VHFAEKVFRASLGSLRPVTYLEEEGLYFEVHYRDADLYEPDNVFSLWFLLSTTALMTLVGRPVKNDADAKSIVREKKTKIFNTIEIWLRKRGLACRGGGPRVILSADLY
jgi:hypothetical protein